MRPVRPVSTTTRVATRCEALHSCTTRSSKTASLPRHAPCCRRFRVSTELTNNWQSSLGRCRAPDSFGSNGPALVSLFLVWIAHIRRDRMLGFGFKYPTRFNDTHLNLDRHTLAIGN